MTEATPPISIVDDSSSAESYPTFWDAIPVDGGGNPDVPAPVDATPPDEAYAKFLTLTEDGPTTMLNVEQTDVG